MGKNHLRTSKQAHQNGDAYYRAIVDHLPITVCRWLPDTTLTFANERYAKDIAGIPNPVGKRWINFVPEQTRAQVEEIYRDLIANPHAVHIEHEVLIQDGTLRWYAWSDVPLFDEQGKLIEFQSIGIDITQHRQTEEKLKERYEFEHLISSLSSRFVGYGDFDEAVQATLKDFSLFCNADRAYIFLWDKHQTTMSNTHEWCADGILPQIGDLQNLPTEKFPWGMAHLRRGECIHINDISTLPPNAQAEKDILEKMDIKSVLVMPLFTNGELAGFVGLDNTRTIDSWLEIHVRSLIVFAEIISAALEHERAEAQLHLLSAALNAAANAIVITDSNGTIEWVNPAFSSMTGYQAEEAIGKTPALLRSGTHENAFYQHLWDTIKTGDVWHGEMTNRRKDGNFYPEMQTITPVKNARGEIAHFVAIKQDISVEKQKEAELLQAQKMEAIGRLAGGVAHDLNNMMTIVLGNAEIAQLTLHVNDQIYQYFQEIKNAGQRAANLTRQLLAFARKQTIAPTELILNDAIEALLKMLVRLIGEDIAITWQPGNNLWFVKMDPSQIDQIMANLVVNARDAISGIGKVTIATENVSFDETHCRQHPDFVPGQYVMLSVGDNGCGMDAETLTHIFEPFFTTKPVGQGTGLGLATVYGIVKQNNGFINVTSQPEIGTVFKIYLPRHITGDNIPESKQANKTMPRGTERVLLVEDEPSVLDLGKNMLELLGYEVITADSTKEAIRLSETFIGDIQLLVTDVVMPEMNGHDLWMKLYQQRPGVKCLFMSGYPEEVITHRGILQEGVQFLQKPFSAETLAVKIREVLSA